MAALRTATCASRRALTAAEPRPANLARPRRRRRRAPGALRARRRPGEERAMAYETLKDSPFVDTVGNLFRDLSDLARKEIRLAKAELAQKLSSRIAGMVW